MADLNSVEQDDLLKTIAEILRRLKTLESKLLELAKRVSTLEG